MAEKLTILPEDVLNSMNAIISVNVPEPQFSSQSKERLSGKAVEDAIYSALVKEFNKFINELTDEQKKIITKKIIDNAKVRTASEVARISKRKSISSKSPTNLPSKLKDCKNAGDDLAELFITEGDSAAGTIVQARDANYQGVLPVRGKILNVMKLDLSNRKQRERFESNSEINDIIKALGTGIGDHFDEDKLRYGKVIFAADADIDGLAINTLLLGVFYKLFRPMIEQGRVYQCVTPLFEISYKKSGKTHFEYAMNEGERQEIEGRLRDSGITYKMSRNKGLGEIGAETFYRLVLDPSNRHLKRITIEDAEIADGMLNLAIGEGSADDRKEWMVDHKEVVDMLGLYE